MARKRKIRFTVADDDFRLLLMLARTERKSIEDLFRESVPEVLAKYSVLVRLSEEPSDPALARRRRPQEAGRG
jgi:transcription antitermination factor NusA-like protein